MPILHQGAAKSTFANAEIAKIPRFDGRQTGATLAAGMEKSYKHQNIS
jgi:hypothetical protein